MRILRPVIIVAVLVASLGATRPADAGILSFEITDGGELAVDFGHVPFQVSADAFGLLLQGTMTLTSGPGTVVIDEENGLTDYFFGPGTVSMFLEGVADDVSGSFQASTDPFSFTVCEGCDTLFEGEGTADDFFIGFGDGLLDKALAKYLGVSPTTLGGGIDFGLEGIVGGPDDTSRFGFDHRGFANLEIGTREAPEPGLAVLLVAGAAWTALRRRHRNE